MKFAQPKDINKRLAAAALAMFSVFSTNVSAAEGAKRVSIKVAYQSMKDVTRTDAWNVTWGKAYDQCRAKYKGIKSVNLLSYTYKTEQGQPMLTANWECRETS
ncbi:hypothetical protein [Ralstonia pseudosolanacearum]|uniref:hypothetical protein n=1 Tax=Ralstonia pseudosolanacearum TaxID=1310165 RepID=UPI0033993ECB